MPNDVPRDPRRYYASTWKSWGDFLGTGNVAPQNRRYRSFAQARKWARAQRLDGTEAWKKLVASGRLPSDIPSNANRIYAKHWQRWEDFLGVRKMARQSKKEVWLAHELAQFLPVDMNHRRATVSHGRPLEIDICVPSKHLVIEYDGWRYHEGKAARDYAKTRQLRDEGWSVIRVREKPLRRLTRNDVIVSPTASPFECAILVLTKLAALGYIKHSAVKSYAIGGRAVASKNASRAIRTPYRSFKDARRWARAQKLSGYSGWLAIRRANRLPPDIPGDPYKMYSTEWTDWGDFLGTGNVGSGNYNWRWFTEARKWARTLGLRGFRDWFAFVKTSNRPKDIPTHPERAYKGEFRGWSDWLNGSGRVSKIWS